MKKIAFFVQHMLCGGVENTLISLSQVLSDAGNDVTIYVIKKNGEFINKIPENVHLKLIPMQEITRKKIPVGGTKICIKECIKNHEFIQAVKYFLGHINNKAEFAELSVDFDKIPSLEIKYDIAVNYHMHSPFLVKYLATKVSSDKKYSWIHNDFSTTKYNIKHLDAYIKENNAILGVSQNIVNEFVSIFPELENKTQVALNIVPQDKILKQAEEYIPKDFISLDINTIKLLTVGRLEEQKGYDIALEVCTKLKNKFGEKVFQWFVLGDGTQRDKLEKTARTNKIDDIMHFIGVKMNPYPYFKDCDIYVQTSRHEGYVTTVTEAKILNRPIVCTDVSGAREQLIDGISGDVADISANSVFEKVSSLIDSKSKRELYSSYLASHKERSKPSWISLFD